MSETGHLLTGHGRQAKNWPILVWTGWTICASVLISLCHQTATFVKISNTECHLDLPQDYPNAWVIHLLEWLFCQKIYKQCQILETTHHPHTLNILHRDSSSCHFSTPTTELINMTQTPASFRQRRHSRGSLPVLTRKPRPCCETPWQHSLLLCQQSYEIDC